MPDTPTTNGITWGRPCTCGQPTSLLHRHGESSGGTVHLAIPMPPGPTVKWPR